MSTGTLGGRSWREVATGLQADASLRGELIAALRACPHRAFFFETVPVSRATASMPFEYALVDSPALAGVRPEPRPFRDRFTGGGAVVTFANRGGDAVLVAPSTAACPLHAGPHLARFVRQAPEDLVHALWVDVGRAVERWWAEREEPVWTSTSGLGVYWLHLRLDRRPKYYTYAPFRRWPQG